MKIPNKGGWKPGKSGNPRGRPKGLGEVGKLRQSIYQHLPGIITQLVTRAMEGDSQAARLLMERVIPPVRSMEQAVKLRLPVDADLFSQGQSIMQAVAEGILAPDQGSALLTSLGTLAKIKEMDELEKRLIALEEANEHKK